MEPNFPNSFEDVRHERSLFLLSSLADSDILKQSEFTDHELKIIKFFALEKVHRQKCLKEIFALQLLEWYFLFNKCWLIRKLKKMKGPSLLKITTKDDEKIKV